MARLIDGFSLDFQLQSRLYPHRRPNLQYRWLQNPLKILENFEMKVLTFKFFRFQKLTDSSNTF